MDPRMKEVLSALGLLTPEDRARFAARWREDQLILDQMARAEELELARKQGREKGREEARSEAVNAGRAEALRQVVVDLGHSLGLPLDAAREAWIAGLDLTALEPLPLQLVRERRWPEPVE